MKLLIIAYKYLKKYPGFTALALLSVIIGSLFEGASLVLLIPLIQSMTISADNLLERITFFNRFGFSFPPLAQIQAISLVFVAMLIVLLTKNIFVYFSEVFIAKLRFGTMRDLRVGLMDSLLEYDISFFDRIKKGHIINIINNETERMGNFFLSILYLFSFLVRVITYVIILFLISWKVSIAIFFLIATVLIPLELIMKRIKRIGARISETSADYNYKLTELIDGIRLIKVNVTEDFEKRDFKTKADNVYHYCFTGNRYMHLIIPLSETFIFSLIVAFFLIIINNIKFDIVSTFPFVAAYLLMLTKMLSQLNALNNRRSDAMNRLAAFDNYEQMRRNIDKQTIKSGKIIISNLNSKIEFRNVNFSYHPGKLILKNINIEVPQGKMTAIVGVSGAGKTSLMNLLLRFYDVDEGEILVDGMNLKELDIKQWRRKIGLVSQDIFIFHSTVIDNITYGRSDISKEDLLRSTKAANAHDFILALPNGYDTILGERGVKLSGGQKQRIAIARSLLHNPELLILDEATSSLDSETEKLIKRAIDTVFRKHTIIAIAHRLSTILDADHIVVINEGSVVEEGKHLELLQNGRIYKRLYEMQFSSA